jgi:hypothetical protein
VVSVAVALAICFAGTGCAEKLSAQPRERAMDLPATLSRYAAQLHRTAPYREPTRRQRRVAAAGLATLLDDDGNSGDNVPAAQAELAAIGYEGTETVDADTGRRLVMFRTPPGAARGWGVVVVDLSAPPSLVVEVPHPNFDLHTELPGAALFEQVPGSILLMAGAHRRADHGRADVAHEPDSIFNTLATALARRGLPQIQLHGFDDASLPGTDTVISTGRTAPTRPAYRAATLLADTGLRVCRAWAGPCGQLEGTTNVQGDEARHLGTFFLHVELSRGVRDHRSRWLPAVRALAGAGIQRS